jgi:hypothetical protein
MSSQPGEEPVSALRGDYVRLLVLLLTVSVALLASFAVMAPR